MFDLFNQSISQYSLGFYFATAFGVILMGISKSGFGAGIGFLAVPLIASQSNVNIALALLLPILVATDLMGLRIYLKHFDKNMMKLILPAGIVGTLLGVIFFKQITPAMLSISIGIFTLLFLVQRLWMTQKLRGQSSIERASHANFSFTHLSKKGKWVGRLLAMTSGFTSFIAHNGGPPMTAFLITRKLDPIVYTATLGVFFTAINFSKWIPYGYLGLIDFNGMAIALVFLPLVPIGVHLGFYAAKKIPQATYYKIVYVSMFLGGVKMIWDGILK